VKAGAHGARIRHRDLDIDIDDAKTLWHSNRGRAEHFVIGVDVCLSEGPHRLLLSWVNQKLSVRWSACSRDVTELHLHREKEVDEQIPRRASAEVLDHELERDRVAQVGVEGEDRLQIERLRRALDPSNDSAASHRQEADRELRSAHYRREPDDQARYPDDGDEPRHPLSPEPEIAHAAVTESAPESAPETDTSEQSPNHTVPDSPLDAFRIGAGDRLDVIDATRGSKQDARKGAPPSHGELAAVASTSRGWSASSSASIVNSISPNRSPARRTSSRKAPAKTTAI